MKKRIRMVLIEWYDSNSLHGWQYGEYPAVLALCTSVGYVIEETEEKIVLVQTVSEFEAHMGVIVIAKGCIKSIKEMRVK